MRAACRVGRGDAVFFQPRAPLFAKPVGRPRRCDLGADADIVDAVIAHAGGERQDCVLDVVLYPDRSGDKVTYLEAREDGATKMAPRTCLNKLLRARNGGAGG